MKPFRPLFLFIGFLVLTGLACGESAPSPTAATLPPVADAAPKDGRLLSLAVTQTENEEYDAAFALAQSLGMADTSFTIFWDEIETAPGEFNADPNWLEVANTYYPAQHTAVSLTISVLDTVTVRVPSDLAGKPFADPDVIARFNQFLDYVFSQIPDLDLTTLAIGNEIDGVLGTDAAQWAAFETFYAETAAHARTLRPGLLVGSKGMFSGMTGAAAAYFQSLNRHSDVVQVTYYPLNGDFTVRLPDTVHGDFQAIADLYPDKPIYFLELGYPAGVDNNSSPEQQAEFIRQTFRAWDDHTDHIRLITFVWLTDVPDSQVAAFTRYYGLGSRGFVSYLATLGLRDADGRAKPALAVLQAEAKARGW